MGSAMDDFFGSHSDRPDTPEFWRISEIVLSLDASVSDVAPGEKESKRFFEIVSEYVDPDVLVYVAAQRAMKGGAGDDRLMTFFGAAYLEAFVLGCKYVERKRRDESG